MTTLAVSHVSVWLDDMAPERGAFAHALEWASRLSLPLRALVAPPEIGGGQVIHRLWHLAMNAGRTAPYDPPAKLEECEFACRQHGVTWDASKWQGPLKNGVEHFLRPVELCVFGNNLAPTLKEELLRKSLRSRQTSVLVCSRSWEPVSRVLILIQSGDPRNPFLEMAVRVCRAFQVAPVILTVAWSAKVARERQRLAENTFSRHRVPADFDFVVGCDVDTAVTRVANWRRCTHVFVERQNAPSWYSWLRRDPTERLLGQSATLTFLALPEAMPAPGDHGEEPRYATADVQ